MSLENRRSSLVNFNDSGRRGGKDVSRFGTIYRSPNPVSDIEKTAIPVDSWGKSKVTKTIPVHMIPQPEPVKEVVKEEKIELENPIKKEDILPVSEKKTTVFASGSTSSTKF